MERHIFDENQPAGSMSLMNLRNVLRALFQGDLMPLRPRASIILDDMEYSADAQAQAKWSGTGVTVTKTTTKQEGNYALQCVVDATGNRKVSKTQSLNLSAFKRVKIWERCSATSSAFQFYLRDGSGNESYWNLTSNGTANTFQQDDKDLTVPDSNNGANASLASITEWGFLGLDASATYIFDTDRVTCGLNVAVEAGLIASFYQQVYVGQSRISFAGGSSPTITPPTTNPRIDLLVMNSSGTLSWVTGTEASSPAEPTFPTDKIPVCLIYCKATMAKVVDYEDKDANPNEAYIYKDVRPLLNLALNTFLQLTDTPSSYAGQAGKAVVVKSTEDQLEFGTATEFRSGDMMVSSNTTPPTGWTDVSVIYDNKFIRISSGVPLTAGGADTHSHTLVIANLPSHNHGLTGATIANESAHTHSVTMTLIASGGSGAQVWQYTDLSNPISKSTNAGTAHTHTFSGNTDATGSGTSITGDNVPAYVQMRIFKKN